jgi:hypothetical protein
MSDPDLSCREERRRKVVRAAPLFGLDYAEVSDDQRTISVYFLGKAPARIDAANLRLVGGRRIRDVRTVSVRLHRQSDPTRDDYMDVTVDKPGDFSTYTLSVVALDERGHQTDQPLDGFDSRYDAVSFSFKAGCPSDLDCRTETVCPPALRAEPEINYLAKDYGSFRQLILDRLALIMPNWSEAHVPDLGITLVELLAYAGDYLSYYQDAVATEAYLGTARQRISVRRHARLLDYAMHEGCNARAWVTVAAEGDVVSPLDATEIYFVTPFLGSGAAGVINAESLATVPPETYEVFEPLWPAKLSFYAAHSEMHFYTWGDCQCCLAKGATSATLVDRWVGEAVKEVDPTGDVPPAPSRALHLQVGDVLIFEEVLGPKTGNPADADPTHRQAVRLTAVTPSVDPLYRPEGSPHGQPVVEIEWAPEDALTFTLCISSEGPPPDCVCLENVTVARGNVILVDSGSSGSALLGTVPTKTTAPRCQTECEPAEVEVSPSFFRPIADAAPLTFSQPIPAGACSAAEMILQDPRQALPCITLQGIPPAPTCEGGDIASCQIPALFAFSDLEDPRSLAAILKQAAGPNARYLVTRLCPATAKALADWDGTSPLPLGLRAMLIADLTILLEQWLPERDLLESGPDDARFVVEIDDDGRPHVRFGDGQLGRMPDAGMAFVARLRVGNGPSGDVGADMITYLVLRSGPPPTASLSPRNPLPAVGGTAPEPVAEVKRFTPDAFRAVLERAITAGDYAALAGDNARRLAERDAVMAPGAGAAAEPCLAPFHPLQGARATLVWTGSWYEAFVAIDPAGSEGADAALVAEVDGYLEPYRRVGHDLTVAAALYVPLDLGLTVCVLPHYLWAHVEAALLDVLGTRVLPDGRLGFFHPDNLTFGEGIYQSRIVAAVQAVEGVQNVTVIRLKRLDVSEPAPSPDVAPDLDDLPVAGVLALGPLEIARLDADPDFPENGRLTLDMRGGR